MSTIVGKHLYCKQGTTENGQSFLLRPAYPDDGPKIVDNINAICAEEVYLQTDSFVKSSAWERIIINGVDEQNRWLLAVIEVDSRVVGHGRLFSGFYGCKDRHVANVGLAIIAPYRGIGLGKAMLRYLIEWAQAMGYEKMVVEVMACNERALHLFESLGFEREGVRRKQLKIQGNYVDEVMMAKWL